MQQINTPKTIDDSVINFCKLIAPGAIPEYIQVSPRLWCRQNECYNNVKRRVKRYGGKRQLGWRIQVVPDPLPKYMIEAVHHAIWITEEGEKIDITPQPNSGGRIFFCLMIRLNLVNLELEKSIKLILIGKKLLNMYNFVI